MVCRVSQLIHFGDLVKILEIIFSNIQQETKKDSFELKRDYYLCVELNETEVMCGQLYDDWSILEPILSKSEYGIALMLDHLSALLRYIAYEISNISQPHQAKFENRNSSGKHIVISFSDLQKILSTILENIEGEIGEDSFELDIDDYFYIPLKESYDNVLADWPSAARGHLQEDWKSLKHIISNPNEGKTLMLEPLSQLLKFIAFKSLDSAKEVRIN